MTGSTRTPNEVPPATRARLLTQLRPARCARLAGVTIAVVLGAGSLTDVRPLHAQLPPVALELLAAGFSPDRRLSIRTKGPSDILQAKIVVQPGGDTGWHTHPGPVIVVVKTGTVTEYHENGCVSVHPEGSVFIEAPDEVHRVVNDSGVAGEAYATFLIPHGTEPLIPADAPAPRACHPHRGGHHHGDRN